ncbi:MAG: metalloregulator ArsR/SmtB family transcription factor [Acidimicrobiia bacterium]|nr:metalloregulator ArsR/SmtB family transcription factor [Acidimicrobiia bacterium]
MTDVTQTSPDGPTLHGPAPGGPAFAVGHGDHAVAGGCCGGAVDWLPADEAEEIAHQLAAVADPVRLQMLSIIARAPRGEVCACDFVGPIEKSQPTISHHLKVLAEAGLVEGEKRGRWVWYQLSPSALTGLLGSVTRATSAPASSVPTAD